MIAAIVALRSFVSQIGIGYTAIYLYSSQRWHCSALVYSRNTSV